MVKDTVCQSSVVRSINIYSIRNCAYLGINLVFLMMYFVIAYQIVCIIHLFLTISHAVLNSSHTVRVVNFKGLNFRGWGAKMILWVYIFVPKSNTMYIKFSYFSWMKEPHEIHENLNPMKINTHTVNALRDRYSVYKHAHTRTHAHTDTHTITTQTE